MCKYILIVMEIRKIMIIMDKEFIHLLVRIEFLKFMFVYATNNRNGEGSLTYANEPVQFEVWKNNNFMK